MDQTQVSSKQRVLLETKRVKRKWGSRFILDLSSQVTSLYSFL